MLGDRRASEPPPIGSQPTDALRAAWSATTAPLAAGGPTVDTVFASLLGSRAPGRFHSLARVPGLLEVARSLEHRAEDLTAIRLAIWFRAATYRACDRAVADQLELASRSLQALEVAGARRAEVTRLLYVLDGHRPGPDDPNGDVVCDVDLSVLGASAQEYDGYRRAVRREVHSDEAWRSGRAAFLAAMDRRPSVFSTPEMRARFEARAQMNLAREATAAIRDAGTPTSRRPGP